MFEFMVIALLSMVGGALTAGVIAWAAWMLLRWTRFPGIGPVIAFAALALSLHSNPFTQMLLMFSGLLALTGFATLFVPFGASKEQGSSARSAKGTAPRT